MNSDQRKQMVTDFYDLAFNQRQPARAAELYLDPGYRQHNAEAADGAAGFVRFVNGFTAAHPQLRLDIKRVLADGEFVVLHVHARFTPQDRGAAVIDIFRVRDEKIVEHWDVVQPIAEQPLHSNGPF